MSSDNIIVSRKVVEQALEALKKAQPVWGGTCAWHPDVNSAIDALRTILATVEPADEITRLRAELAEITAAIPGVRYMDPPDGGSVTLAEQVARMAKDADELAAIKGQEPVAYIHRQGRHWEVSERILDDDEKARGWTEEPLYALPVADKDAYYEALERKHLGDSDKGTGIYAPLHERKPEDAKDADPFNCPKCGRHDFGLYGYCPSCDAAMAKGE